jgi:8-oxo-dGTP diphosphatase
MANFEELHKRPFLPLATERLLLRPIKDEDAPEIAQLLSNKNVSQTTATIPYPYSLDDAISFISSKVQGMNSGKPVLVLSIIDRVSCAGKLLGVIGYERNVIGYWLGEPYWGRGYMKEAVKTMVHFLFGPICKIPCIELSSLPTNVASVKIIEVLGCTPTFEQDTFSVSMQQSFVAQFYKITREKYLAKYEASLGCSVPIVWVAAAALVKNGKLLIAKRPKGKPMSGLWELPGGKIECGETPESAIVRELQEELGITTDPHELVPISFASYRYEKFHLVMPLFMVCQWMGDLHAKEDQCLAWIHYQDLVHYPSPAADITLFHTLHDKLSKEGLWC